MSYTTTEVVQGLMARINNNAPISTQTSPNVTQVQAMIAGVSAEVDMHLASSGYVVPVTTPDVMVTWLGQVTAYGVVAEVLKSQFPETQVAPNGGPVIPAYAFWETRYQNALKAIDNRTIVSGDAAMSGASLARTYQTDNPENIPWEDGTPHDQQPYISMQKVF